MALKSVCLDTDILIDHLRGDEEAKRQMEVLEATGNILTTTTLNAFELYYGAQKTKKRQNNIEAVRVMISRLVLLDFNDIAAEKAGEIAAQLEVDGAQIGFRDVLIGATVLINNCELLTGNVRHFEKIREIKFYSPK